MTKREAIRQYREAYHALHSLRSPEDVGGEGLQLFLAATLMEQYGFDTPEKRMKAIGVRKGAHNG